MESAPYDVAGSARESDALREYDGAQRVARLLDARAIALAPGADDAAEPVYVWIEWSAGIVERPLPGSAIWRAVLSQYLNRPAGPDPTEPAVRRAVAMSLSRWPTLERWLAWRDHQRTLPAARPEARPAARRWHWLGIRAR